MKDEQNNFRDLYDDQNRDTNFEKEEKKYDDYSENSQEREKNEEDYQEEEKDSRQADDKKAEELDQEAGYFDKEKAECDSHEVSTDEKVFSEGERSEGLSHSHEGEENYSCSYQPPDYIPNFTMSPPPPRAKKSMKMGLITLAAIVFLASVIGGCVIVLKWLGSPSSSEGEPSDTGLPTVGTEQMTVVKNDGSIQVNVEIGSTGSSNLTIPQVVERVADTVVEIITEKVQTGQFGFGQYVTSGAGSGVLIDKEGRGYIITNNHVIGDAPNQTKITVRLRNGSEYDAKFIAGDADHDIAILKIEATVLPYSVLGSSSNVKVGEAVVAIGNPLGELGGTVTNGIVSALDRTIIVDGERMTLMQTNAEINPGNSGGGLFDMAGQLIGIVNAKQSQTGIEGLGFAIPIDVAWAVAQDLIQYGYVTGRLQLGFDVTEHTQAFQMQGASQGWFATYYDFPAGVYVSETTNDQFQYYDRIVSINGVAVKDGNDYYRIMDQVKKGDTLNFVLSRLKVSGSKYGFEDVTVSIVATFTEPPTPAQ